MTIAEQIVQAKQDYDAVYDAGKKAEYDAFWDVFQQNGTRTSYHQAFRGWNIKIFRPKYNIKVVGYGENVFYNITGDEGSFGLASRLDELGVTLDTSEATSVNQMFAYYKGVDLPYLDFSSAISTGSSTSMAQTVFSHANNLVTIKGIKLNEGVNLYRPFIRCDKLENITFDGVIANDIDFKDCKKLSYDSIYGIISHLKRFAGTGEEHTRTITMSAETYNKMMDEGSWHHQWVTDDFGWNLTVV